MALVAVGIVAAGIIKHESHAVTFLASLLLSNLGSNISTNYVTTCMST